MKGVTAVKKIMIMINGLYSGGAEKVLQTVLNNLDYSEFDVTLYSMHQRYLDPAVFKNKDKIKYKAVFSEYNGVSSLLKKVFGFSLKVKGKLFKYLPPSLFRMLYIRGRFDTEIAFLEGEATKIVSGSLNKKTRKIAWVHTDMIKNNWTDYLYSDSAEEAKAYKKFDRIVCVSESVKNAFIKKYGISDNVTVKYNPVDSDEILLKSKEKIHIKAENRPLIISTGRLEQPKGYPRLCECACRLKKEGYDFTLWILGDGTQRKQLEDYIEENRLAGTISLLGFDRNPYKYMAAADAFICSSYIEGFSTAATESIILGKPVYTVDCSGMKELFGNENCGEITENTDEALYLLLKRAATDRNAMAEYTKSAERRSEFFDIRKRMSDIENVFRGE